MKAKRKPGPVRLPRFVWFVVNPRNGRPVHVYLNRPHRDAVAEPYVRSLPRSRRLNRGAGIFLPQDREQAEAAGWRIVAVPLADDDGLMRVAFLNAETALEGLVEAYENDDKATHKRYVKELAQIRAYRLKRWGKTAFESETGAL